MIFEWDQEKRKINYEKHGIYFDLAELIFQNPILSKVDQRKDYGEKRVTGLGLLSGRVVVIIFTKIKNKIRVISLRKANRREGERYYNYLK